MGIKSVARWTALVAAAGLCIGGIYYRNTVHGIWVYKFAKWEEDAFLGKTLFQLEDRLHERGRRLHQPDMNAFTLRTNRTLKENERVLQFVHGKGYPWFSLGTAHNLGYVIVSKRGGEEEVMEILRFLEIDSL
jgi:hypothetical protein